MEKIDLQSTTPTPVAPAVDPTFASTLERNSMKAPPQKTILIAAAVVVVLGLATGYAGAVMTKSSGPVKTIDTTTEAGVEAQAATVKVGQVFGAKDTSAFKDSAEGVVVAGGIGSEGSHHIVRPGGENQNVYLTSSVLDLKMFENHKIKVYGETFKAQKAGWLMDVSRVEVQQLNAPLPDWAQKKAAAAGNSNE